MSTSSCEKNFKVLKFFSDKIILKPSHGVNPLPFHFLSQFFESTVKVLEYFEGKPKKNQKYFKLTKCQQVWSSEIILTFNYFFNFLQKIKRNVYYLVLERLISSGVVVWVLCSCWYSLSTISYFNTMSGIALNLRHGGK